MDEFFEADAHDVSHWRYWDTCIREVGSGGWEAKVHGEWKPVSDPRFITPRNRRDAAVIASHIFGGRPIPETGW